MLHLRLEALESQQALIDLIVDAKTGMGEKRKALQSLGPNPNAEAAQAILNQAQPLAYRKKSKNTPNHKCPICPTQAAPYVLAYKKHVKVANNLNLNQHILPNALRLQGRFAS